MDHDHDHDHHNHDHDYETTTIFGETTTPLPPGVCIPRMDMSLHWGTCEWILVKTWKADTTGKLKIFYEN